jgi:hypothetical protein
VYAPTPSADEPERYSAVSGAPGVITGEHGRNADTHVDVKVLHGDEPPPGTKE